MSSSRQLAAIMFTDLVGYTALMAKDSPKAMELVQTSIGIQKPLVENHKGKWLKEMGDGVLVQFNSALDAVNCAIDIQKSARAELDAKLRIGIHLGDITIDNEEIFGDGVNVASRLESICDPGGIYISQSINRAIKGENIETLDLGNRSLKNVDDDIRIFAVQGVGLPVPQKKKSPPNLKPVYLVVSLILVVVLVYFLYPQKSRAEITDKSIAVLPFKNLSADEENQYFADGMMEDILNNLTRIEAMKVISRTSSDQYRDRADKSLVQIAEELGIAYVLEGSVRRSNDQVRITVQLIDAREDRHVWSHNYDRNLVDVFAVQTEISKEIAKVLQAKISPAEEKYLEKSVTENFTAYDHLLHGRETMWQVYELGLEEGLNKAEASFRKAIEIDSSFAMAYTYLAELHFIRHLDFGLPRSYLDTALLTVNKALAIDSTLFEAYILKSDIFQELGRNTEMREMMLKAITINPNSADSYEVMASLANLEYKSEEMIVFARKALELDPANTHRLAIVAQALNQLGYIQESINTYEKVLSYNPNSPWVLVNLAAAYALNGQLNEAIEVQRRLGEDNDKNPFYLFRSAEFNAWAGNLEVAKNFYERYISVVEAPDFVQSASIPPYRARYGYVLWNMGDRDKALKLFQEQIDISRTNFENEQITGFNEAYDLAGIYATMDDIENAEFWFSKLNDEDFLWINWAVRDPYFKNIRDTKFYQDKLNRWTQSREQSIKRLKELEEGYSLSMMLNK